MGKLIFGKLLLFALISIMFLHFTEMNAQYNRTTPQQQTRTNISVDGNELLGRLFKKNKDKEESKKEKKKGKRDDAQQDRVPTSLAKDGVSLIVSGDGSTKEEATKAALRSAIEQTYGTFVSSNTDILNDELVKDEIVTVSAGNIKSYQYLSERETGGKYYVTIQAVVSIGKLVSYSKSKGSEAELAGATFAMNIKLEKLYAQNERKAMDNLFEQLRMMLPCAYDYTIETGEPEVGRFKGYMVPCHVKVTTTKVVEDMYDLFWNTVSELSKNAKHNGPCFYLSEGGRRSQIRYTRNFYGSDMKYIANKTKEAMCSFNISDGSREYAGIKSVNNIQWREVSNVHLIVGSSLGSGDGPGELLMLATRLKQGTEVCVIDVNLEYSLEEIEKISKITVIPKNNINESALHNEEDIVKLFNDSGALRAAVRNLPESTKQTLKEKYKKYLSKQQSLPDNILERRVNQIFD